MLGPMSVLATLRRLGGCATWSALVAHHPQHEVRRAHADGSILRLARGRYAVPEVEDHRRRAAARTATLSHLSAALHHGWAVKTVPDSATVTVRRHRNLRGEDRVGIRPYWADLAPSDVHDGVTTPLRTVLDCARTLPFDEGLAVADSALRARAVTPQDLRGAAARVRGPGAPAVRRVARHADARAANPFESVLRALAIEVGLDLTPQLMVAEPGLFAIVDLGSEQLRLAVEADGFATHGTRRALRADCRRHTGLAVYGWSSLRFSYEDVMFDQDWTRWALRTWKDAHTGSRRGRARRPQRRADAA